MRIAALGLLLASFCLAACDDTTNTITVHLPQVNPLILRTVNGRALPVTVFDSITPRFRLDVVSGGFAFNTNGTFSQVTEFREIRANVIVVRTVTCVGTFSGVGSTFTFVAVNRFPDCGGTFTGVLVDGLLSTSIRGFPAIYNR
jgi:hypothetical protein